MNEIKHNLQLFLALFCFSRVYIINYYIRAKEDREKLEVSIPSISTTTLLETQGLKEEPRKKILKQISEEKLNAGEVRDIVRKVKEFPEPEQMEMEDKG